MSKRIDAVTMYAGAAYLKVNGEAKKNGYLSLPELQALLNQSHLKEKERGWTFTGSMDRWNKVVERSYSA
jgi:hypothetical protein